MSASCVETVVAWCRSNAFQAASRGVDTKCTIGRASSANTSSVFITQLIQSTWAVHLACEVRIQITWIVVMAERLSVEQPKALRQLDNWKQCKGIMENLETDSPNQTKTRAFLHSVMCVKLRHLFACFVHSVQLLPIFSEALRKYPSGQSSTPWSDWLGSSPS